MIPFFVLLALVALGVVAVVAGGRGGGLGEAGSDRPGPWLPSDRELSADDVDQVHFGVGFRGYRMDEVDDVLDRLAEELRSRDARLAALGYAPPAERAAGDETVNPPPAHRRPDG